MNIASQTSHPHLVVEGLTKRFGDVVAVSDFSLRVPRGRTLALLGPSGCGKTTVLRLIAGLDWPDAGSIHLDDKVLADATTFIRPERRRIGMVFQDGALFPHMSVAANVGYGLGRHPSAELVTSALKRVDLEGFEDRMPATLSGGQAQRVALARALVPEPDVLLLDEPFAALDAELRIRVRAEVAELLRSLDITAVFVTHDQEEAFVVGDEVAVMRFGEVLQVGKPHQVYNEPTSPWIANFVGDANLIDGQAEGELVTTSIGPIRVTEAHVGSVRVVVRPEHVAIGAGSAGTVTAVQFYGHDTSYQVALGGHTIEVRHIAAPRFEVGDGVDVSYGGPLAVAFPARAAVSG